MCNQCTTNLELIQKRPHQNRLTVMFCLHLHIAETSRFVNPNIVSSVIMLCLRIWILITVTGYRAVEDGNVSSR